MAPFSFSDGTCPHCVAGVTVCCAAGGSFGNGSIDGGQGPCGHDALSWPAGHSGRHR
ncbi:MAG: hypothetical protein WCK21_09565 [Actinomycetota bacterium]